MYIDFISSCCGNKCIGFYTLPMKPDQRGRPRVPLFHLFSLHLSSCCLSSPPPPPPLFSLSLEAEPAVGACVMEVLLCHSNSPTVPHSFSLPSSLFPLPPPAAPRLLLISRAVVVMKVVAVVVVVVVMG